MLLSRRSFLSAAALAGTGTALASTATAATPTVLTNETLVFQSPTGQAFTLSGVTNSGKYTVRNARGSIVDSGPIATGAATFTTRLGVGWYDLTIADTQDTPIKTSFMVAPQQTQNPKLGVCVHLSNPPTYYPAWKPSVLPLARAVGAGTIRDDLFLENFTAGGGFTTPATVSNMITLAAKNSLSFLGIADFAGTYSPAGGGFPQTTSQMSTYGSQIASFLTKNPTVKKVEIWNEYNQGMGMLPSQPRTGTSYAKMLPYVYGIVKRIHPSVTVIVGATAQYDSTWWREFFAAGGGSYADAFSFHPYGASESELSTFIADIRALSVKYTGSAKPVAITETGWNDLGLGRTTHVGPRGAADRLPISLVHALAEPLVREVHVYDLINDGPDVDAGAALDETTSEANYGLFHVPSAGVTAYAPKQTAFSFWYLNERIQSGAGAPSKVGYRAAGRVAEYKLNDTVTMLMQSRLGATSLVPVSYTHSLSKTARVRVTNAMGEEVLPAAERQSVPLTLTDSPVYVSTVS